MYVKIRLRVNKMYFQDSKLHHNINVAVIVIKISITLLSSFYKVVVINHLMLFYLINEHME